MINLFGEYQPIIKAVRGKNNIIKARMKYRKSGSKDVRCKTCEHIVVKHFSKKYYKCELIGLSASVSSDILVSNVFDNWEKYKD